MKLYQTFTSPFPTRVRLALYAKNIPVEIIEPPGFHSSEESKGDYIKVNPIGRVPTLVLDDGRCLPESEVICEYLEDAFPDPPLLPADPWARAQVRLISRICDIYLVMAMIPLFNASGSKRADWNAARIEHALGEVHKALGFLELYIGTEGYAVGDRLSWADGALTPQLILAFEWAPTLFGKPSPLGDHPKLAGYWTRIQADPFIARLMTETRDAIAHEQVRARAAGRR